MGTITNNIFAQCPCCSVQLIIYCCFIHARLDWARKKVLLKNDKNICASSKNLLSNNHSYLLKSQFPNKLERITILLVWENDKMLFFNSIFRQTIVFAVKSQRVRFAYQTLILPLAHELLSVATHRMPTSCFLRYVRHSAQSTPVCVCVWICR